MSTCVCDMTKQQYHPRANGFTDDIEIKDGTTTIFKGSSGIQKDREVILYNLKVNSFGSNQGGKIELYDNSVNKVFSVNNAGTMEVAGDATLKKSFDSKIHCANFDFGLSMQGSQMGSAFIQMDPCWR